MTEPKKQKKKRPLQPYLLPRVYQLVHELYNEDMPIQNIADILSWNPSRQRIHQIINDDNE